MPLPRPAVPGRPGRSRRACSGACQHGRGHVSGDGLQAHDGNGPAIERQQPVKHRGRAESRDIRIFVEPRLDLRAEVIGVRVADRHVPVPARDNGIVDDVSEARREHKGSDHRGQRHRHPEDGRADRDSGTVASWLERQACSRHGCRRETWPGIHRAIREPRRVVLAGDMLAGMFITRSAVIAARPGSQRKKGRPAQHDRGVEGQAREDLRPAGQPDPSQCREPVGDRHRQRHPARGNQCRRSQRNQENCRQTSRAPAARQSHRR